MMRLLNIAGVPRAPIMRGMSGPYTSTSTSPTRAPVSRRARARLTATVDFPTPPLPEETAIVCLTSGMRSSLGGSAGGGAPGRLGPASHRHLHVGHSGQRGHHLARLAVDLGLRHRWLGRELEGEGHAAR